MVGQSIKGASAALLVGSLAAISTTLADVTIESRFSVAGSGIMSAGNTSGTSTTIISGDRMRVDSDMQLNSGLLRALTRGAMGPSAQIVRLDGDKIISLDIKKKQYTEQTFEEIRTQMQKASERTTAQGGNTAATPAVVDESKCDWLEPTATVNRTGQKTTIAGFDAELVQITASQPCKDRSTGAICEVAIGVDEWLAPQYSSSEEAQKFGRAYAQKMGVDLGALSHDAVGSAQTLFGRYKGTWMQISSKMKEVKGYPVRSRFTLAVGGSQCQDSQTPQNSANDGGEAVPTNTGALANRLSEKVAGAFFHKKASETTTPAPAPPVPAGTIPLVTVSSELVSVSAAAATAESFDVPAGFRKIEMRTVQ